MPKVLYIDENKTVEIPKGENTYHFKLNTDYAQADLLIDFINSRLRVLKIIGSDIGNLLDKIYQIAELNSLGKIWAVASIEQWDKFLKWGYLLEGILPKYFISGPAYYMSYFLDQDRRISTLVEKEDELIRSFRKENLVEPIPNLPEKYEMKIATEKDAESLAEFYDMIFPTYPTPMEDPKYILKMMNDKVIFNIISWQGKIVAAASADIDETSKTVEMTDIACSPEHRGKKLPIISIYKLEEKLKKMGMVTLYSLARSRLPGINKTFYRLGYIYYGRLINNCHICGRYEDMNVLAKII